MKNTIEKTVKNSDKYLRGYCYIGEIKLNKKHSIFIENSMVDGYDHDCFLYVGYVKIKGIFNKTVDKDYKSYNDLGFEPPRKNGRYDEDVAVEYMQDMMSCFDVETMKFDHEKALEIKKQYEQTKHENYLKESSKDNSRVHEKVETKVQVKNEDKNF